MKNRLKFEKVSDISYKYCFIDIYIEGSNNPFMDIRISEESNEIIYNIYKSSTDIQLNIKEWIDILEKSNDFLKKEIENNG